MKAHYLQGITHEGALDGKRVLTTWEGVRAEADKRAEEMRGQGAVLTRVFIDGKVGYRIVAYFA